MPSIASEDESEQQSAKVLKHETEHESGWEMKGELNPEPRYDQRVYTVLEQRRDRIQIK